MFGSGAAIVMRIVLTLIAVKMLGLPYLKLAGGLALLWIGANLMSGEEEQHDREARPIGIGAAVRTILIADLVMSLDNVLAVAAAAQGNTLLLVVGLAVSIPLIVFGSTLILKVMERLPVHHRGRGRAAGLAGGRDDVHRPRAWADGSASLLPESTDSAQGAPLGAILVVIAGQMAGGAGRGAEPSRANGASSRQRDH